MRDVVQQLVDAVSDWVSIDGGSTTGLYLMLPSGISFDLSNLSVPSIENLSGFRLKIGGYNIDIPTDAVLSFSPGLNVANFLGATFDPPVPGSENWLFGGPLRESVWPPEVGTSGSFSEVQYYRLSDVIIDGTVASFAIAIAFVLTKIGLTQLASRFVRRLMSRNTISNSNEIRQLLTNTSTLINTANSIDNKVNSLASELGTGGGTSIHQYMSSFNVILTAIDTAVDTIKVTVEASDGMIDSNSTDLTSILTILNDIQSNANQIVAKLIMMSTL
jgi:hypothetical protein